MTKPSILITLLLWAPMLQAADPLVGVWTFDQKSSTCTETPNGTLPVDVLTVTESGDVLLVEVHRPDQKEFPVRKQTWYMDGTQRAERMAYRGPRNSTFDKMLTRRNPGNGFDEEYFKNGKLIGKATFRLSPDGTTLTIDRATKTFTEDDHKDHFVYRRKI